MSKGVNFTEKDKKLIQQIEKYQNKNGISSFVGASENFVAMLYN